MIEEKLQKLQDEITTWADSTFGGNRKPKSVIAHLAKEVMELYDDPTDLSEYADVLILTLNAAKLAGYDVNLLVLGIEAKMIINKQRKWGKPDNNGVIEHIKE
jgi:hypothetical protein